MYSILLTNSTDGSTDGCEPRTDSFLGCPFFSNTQKNELTVKSAALTMQRHHVAMNTQPLSLLFGFYIHISEGQSRNSWTSACYKELKAIVPAIPIQRTYFYERFPFHLPVKWCRCSVAASLCRCSVAASLAW